MTHVRSLAILLTTASVLAAAALLVGCTGETSETPTATTAGGGATSAAPVEAVLPEGLLVTATPGEFVGVGEAQKTAKEGDTIIVRGRVGGTDSYPFTKGRAIMTIADTDNVADCTQKEGDSCETPWDYCCDRDILEENIASVLVRAPDGKLIKAGLEGLGGLKPLSVVVVEGVVGPRPEPQTLEIHASAIYVEE